MKNTITPALSLQRQAQRMTSIGNLFGLHQAISEASPPARIMQRYLSIFMLLCTVALSGCQNLASPLPQKAQTQVDSQQTYQQPTPAGEAPIQPSSANTQHHAQASGQSNAQHSDTPAGAAIAPLALIDDFAGTRPIGNTVAPVVSLGPGDADYSIPAQSLLTGANFNDLWDRIRAGFRMDLTVNNKRVIAERDWYVKHGDYLLKVFERARPYLYHVVNELEAKQLPLELALLPVVESAYDPFAYSRSKAAGIWQFIPSTGASFKLKQNWWYDGRRDIVASTAAATTYLRRLNKMFDGDWEKAMAAYNGGGGTIRRAVTRNARRGKPTDYWSLKLSTETSRYVPKLLALAQIMQNPTHFNITPLPVANRPYFSVIETGGQIDLAQASQMSGVSLEEIYRLNPGFNRWASDPEGPHRLVILIRHAEQFRRALANQSAQQRLAWRRYTVKRGDTLTQIARTFRTSTSDIMQVNHLRTQNIRAGRHLLIPTAATSTAQHLDTTSRYRPTSVSTKTTSPSTGPGAALVPLTQPTKTAEANRKRLNYRVKAGDTLWNIAKRFNSSVDDIARSNNMSPKGTLKVGQTLVISLDGSTAQDTRLALSPDLKTLDTGGPPQDTTRKVHYRVRRGDSLFRIADRFNLKMNDISRWNKLRDNHILQPGQQLVLFVDVRNTATP